MVSIWDFDSQSGGSSPPASANMGSYTVVSSGADCKSVISGLGWCDSITPHHFCRSNSIGGMLPCQGKCRGFDPRLLLQCLYSSVGRAHPWYGWGHAFKPHCKLHFIEGSHSGLVQWFAKSPNKFIVPRVQIPLPLPYIGVWCNGSITVSKAADWGSNPCTPASTNSFMAKSICKSIVE